MNSPNGSSGELPPGASAPDGTQALPTPQRTEALPTPARTQALPTPPRTEAIPTPLRTQALPTPPRTEAIPTPPRTEAIPSPRSAAAPPPGSGTQVLTPSGAAAQAARLASGPAPHAPAEASGAGEFGAGERVRHYELIRRLGRGGMGEVFLARDTKLGRRVAIKFLRTQDPALVERFVLEARATARCSHENIVTLYEADAYQGRPYMVLEYLEGRTLAELAGAKPLPPGRAVELVSPVLRALACAHGQGIVHRDLKPENVMLTSAGVLKVLDFGIAKVQEEGRASPAELLGRAAAAAQLDDDTGETTPARRSDSQLTEHGMTVGTLLYMSPEQWTAESIDHRSDIWAIGIMLYQLLAGRHPLDGLDQKRLGRAVVSAEPMPSLRASAPGVPSRLADAVDACLAKDPAKRPPSAQRVLELLAPFMPGRRERELAADESPYAGLSAFQESNADLFFGRTHEIAALVHRLRDEPMVAVVGPSGVGKSSFVRAGVVPALKRLGESWEAIVVRPGRDPVAALASALVSTAATAGGKSVTDEVREARELQARLVAEPGWAGSMLRAYARRLGRRVMVFVDQLEELFTLAPDPEARRVFSACLAGVADDAASPVRVVVSVRSDFLDRVFEDARLAEARPGLFFLATPGDEALRDALALPAEVAGYRFESPAMLDELVRDLRSTEGALCLLQFAATQLWEARDPVHKVLTRASSEAIGGIAGALARYADRVLEALSPDARRAARELFLRLVTSERTRAVVSREELRELFSDRAAFDRLLDQLVQSRLLVVQKSERGTTVEIVHESLIRSWPALRRWLDESGEDASFLEQLRAGTRQWDSGGRRRGLLWRGETADEARRFQRRYRGQLPETQQAFLEAVVAQATRSARLRRTLIGGGIGALLIVVAASMVALVVIRSAQKEAVRQAELARTAEKTARTAEAEARERAEALAVKERERAAAATRAEAASAELEEKNRALVSALENTTKAEALAKASAAEARREQVRADAAARQLAVRLRQEQDRVKRLKEQFGSPLAETLPP